MHAKHVLEALECLQRLICIGVLRDEPPQLLRALRAARAAATGRNESIAELPALATAVTALACTAALAQGEALEEAVALMFDVAANARTDTSRRAGRAALDFAIRAVTGRAVWGSAVAPPVGAKVEVEQRSNCGTLGTAAQLETLLPLLDARAHAQQDVQIIVTRALEDVAAMQRDAERLWLEERAEEEVGVGQDEGASAAEASSAFVGNLETVMCAIHAASKAAAEGDSETRTVALEALVNMLRLSTPELRANDTFVESVRKHLCSTLLANCASRHLAVYDLSCAALAELFLRMRSELKSECGVFFPTIYLRALEAVSSSKPLAVEPQHAAVALEYIQKCMREPQALGDMYANFDCDVSQGDLFARSVNAIAGVAQALQSPAAKDMRDASRAARITSMRHLALECLGDTVAAMAEWTRMFEDGEAQPALGSESVDGARVGASEDSSTGASRRSSLLDPENKIGIDRGVALFNEKPASGIRLLADGGLIDGDATSVADFLRVANGLSPTAVGEYLGDRAEFNSEVLQAYVAACDFSGAPFSQALRHFLSLFRLPGEAQKIDRIMERFAAHYLVQNPDGPLQSADTAYVLAYSCIMLHTDAHNISIKRKDKMSSEAFIANNRGIGPDGADLPADFLLALYSDIVQNEIKMHDEAQDSRGSTTERNESSGLLLGLGSLGLGVIFNALNAPHMRRLALQGAEERARTLASAALARGGRGGDFAAARGRTVVEPMMKTAWPALLSAYSVVLEGTAEDEEDTRCVLEGLAEAIHVCCALDMPKERDILVSGLAKFCLLVDPAEMREKNVAAFHTLLRVAAVDGDRLDASWTSVLTMCSRFEHLVQLSRLYGEAKGSGLPSESPQHVLHAAGGSNAVIGGAVGVGPSRRQTLTAVQWVISRIDTEQINAMYSRSGQLSDAAIVNFIACLVKVSEEELISPTEPRVYSLQKIVEAADLNIERIRLTWTRLWAILSSYFEAVCCHTNLDVSLHAVDSLRQLAGGFLNQDSLAGSDQFQQDFLRPFRRVFAQQRTTEVRELVIRCASQLALSHVGGLRAGWRSMFELFQAAADDPVEHIVTLAFTTIEKVVRNEFERIAEAHAFQHLVLCLGAFARQTKDFNVSLNSIAFLRYCSLRVADGTVSEEDQDAAELADTPSSPYKRSDSSGGHSRRSSAMLSSREFDVTQAESHFWGPLLEKLATLALDTSRIQVALAALETLGDVMHFHGASFSLQFWTRAVRRVLIPVCCGMEGGAREWRGPATVEITQDKAFLSNIHAHALGILVGTFSKHFESLHVALLSDIVGFLGALVRCKQSPAADTVPATALSALLKLVEGPVVQLMVSDDWSTLFYHLQDTLCLLSPPFHSLVEAYAATMVTEPPAPPRVAPPQAPIVVSAAGGDTPLRRSVTEAADSEVGGGGTHGGSGLSIASTDGGSNAAGEQSEEEAEEGSELRRGSSGTVDGSSATPATPIAPERFSGGPSGALATPARQQAVVSPAAYGRFMAAVREARRVVAVTMLVVSATTRVLEVAAAHDVSFEEMKVKRRRRNRRCQLCAAALPICLSITDSLPPADCIQTGPRGRRPRTRCDALQCGDRQQPAAAQCAGSRSVDGHASPPRVALVRAPHHPEPARSGAQGRGRLRMQRHQAARKALPISQSDGQRERVGAAPVGAVRLHPLKLCARADRIRDRKRRG